MICRDGAHQAAGQEETDGVQQTLDGPCMEALSGFSVCVLSLRKPGLSVCDCNNSIVSMHVCCSTSVEEQQRCWRRSPESSPG